MTGSGNHNDRPRSAIDPGNRLTGRIKLQGLPRYREGLIAHQRVAAIRRTNRALKYNQRELLIRVDALTVGYPDRESIRPHGQKGAREYSFTQPYGGLEYSFTQQC